MYVTVFSRFCVTDYDFTCNTDANCTGANSHCAYLYDGCDNGICRCNEGYYMKSDWTCAQGKGKAKGY